MKNKAIIIIFLIIPVLSQDDDVYEELINIEAPEEYCTEVIGNITKLLEEGYIFLDFYKSPLKPKGDESYDIDTIDIIKELEDIPKTDRKFYDFFRDIQKVIKKTGDNHLAIYSIKPPSSKITLYIYSYTIPFIFKVVDERDDTGNVVDTYLTIAMNDEEDEKEEPFTPPNNKTRALLYENYLDQKIVSINDTDPFEFIDNLFGDFPSGHNSQINFVNTLDTIQNINIIVYPFLKEELSNIKLEFEDGKEYNFSFSFNNNVIGDTSFEEYYIKTINKYIINHIPLPSRKQIYKEYKEKNDPNYKPKRKMDEIEWDYKIKNGLIECKVDEDNKKNVMVQKSFDSKDFYEYQEIMFQCLDAFYSNNYEIIIIESSNSGGYSGLCFPMTQYMRPKILGMVPVSQKDTDLNYEFFMKGDGNLNPETCKPYDSREKLSRSTVDDYGNGVTHNRTKEIDLFNIYSKKSIEEKRRKYIETKNTKKPTEIIIFTDGYSFSCGSVFIKNLQVYGSAIVVGYRAKIDITNKKDFDASQSNSAVESFEESEYANNLNNLGFSASVTNQEQFDPNDEEDPKIPMEFKRYPVDELSDIHVKYSDDDYDIFIKTAQEIFNKYNDNMECNPDNNLLYYETDECDSKLNIEHGHGGYICNNEGTWDTNNCVLKYCDVGYILDITNKKCIEDPCEKIEIKNITLNCDENVEYDIEPNKGYIFTINSKNNENCSLYFYSEYENFIFAYNHELVLKPVENGTQFSTGNKIYSNIFLNHSESVKISIKNTKDETDGEEKKNSTNGFFRRKKKNSGLSTAAIVLMSVFIPLAVIGSLIAAIILARKLSTTHIIEASVTNNPLNK